MKNEDLPSIKVGNRIYVVNGFEIEVLNGLLNTFNR